jgi:hypothetical protein
MKEVIDRHSSERGYVALLSVLVLGAIATAIAVALLTTGADSQRQALVSQQSAQAGGLVDACVEEALQEIHDSTTFTGTDTFSLGQGSCSYTVTNTGGANRTISVNSIVGSVVRKAAVYVTIGASTISITSWQEVS